MKFRMKTFLPALLLGASLIVGCTGDLAGLSSLRPGNAKLSVVAAVRDGQFKTQAVVNPFTKASIHHVVLKLYTVAGGEETAMVRSGSPVEVDVASDSLDIPFTFENLHNDTTYRVKASAYKASGTASADLISTEDANSYLDIVIGRDVNPALQRVPVKLIDRLFAAKGTSSIVVTDGGYTWLDEMITVDSPAPLTYTITGTRDTWWSLDGGQTKYTGAHQFLPTVDVSKLGTAVYRDVTYYVQPAVFVNATNSFIRVDDGNGFNADGSWSGHYLGLQPNATGSLKLVVSGSTLNYKIYYDP